MLPVYKKRSRSDPATYRPISLLSIVDKIFERIVAGALTRQLENNSLITDQQFWFRSGRSTSGLLLLLPRDWQDSLDTGLDTMIVALDIAVAFDRVWHACLLEKIRAKDIQRHLLLLISDYLQGRGLHVVVGGQQSRDLPVGASTPQGSVLGPVLWNVYIDDLLGSLPAVSAYALPLLPSPRKPASGC